MRKISLSFVLHLVITASYAVAGDVIASQAFLKAANAGVNDLLGYSIAVSGDTMVVGAYGEDSSATGVNGSPSDTLSLAGAAYVFVRSGTSWTQQAFLKASNTGASDGFGYSVAIHGDTIVVGAPGEDSPAVGVNGWQGDHASSAQSGAVYVFNRSGVTWSQQAYIKASNTGAADEFGSAVAISNDTIVVGSRWEDSSATGVNGLQGDNATGVQSGAAYVFIRSGSMWSQQAYLKASNTGASDEFGSAVAISNDTIVVGSRYEGSAAVGVNGSQADNASYVQSGAAYVFTRSGSMWSQQAYLKASNTGAGDIFGYSVGISDNTVVVGAPYEDSSATGIGGNQSNNSYSQSGAAYVFTRTGITWTQQAYLKASNTWHEDNFGHAVAISGDTVIIGAPLEDSDAIHVNGNQNSNTELQSGAAYSFERTGTVWRQQSYLKATNTASLDQFGAAVAVSGKTMAVGAYQQATSSGAAYIFIDAPITISESSLVGNLFTIYFSSAANATGWKVMGSENLSAFSEDKTAVSTITQLTPGNYRAVVNVSGEPNKYFLRIQW